MALLVLQAQEQLQAVMMQLHLHTALNGLVENGIMKMVHRLTKEHLAGNVTHPDGGSKIQQVGIQQVSGRR